MGYSHYVGRVGALAVALGVGCAVASPVAWADQTTSAEPSSDTGTVDTSGSQPAGRDTTTGEDTAAVETQSDVGDTAGSTSQQADAEDEAGDQSSPTEETEEVAPGVIVSSSGGAKSSDDSDDGDDGDTSQSSRRDRDEDRATTNIAETTQGVQARTVQGATYSSSQDDETSNEQAPEAITQFSTTSTLSTNPPESVPARVSTFVTTLKRTIISPILSKFLDALPGRPEDSPLGWILLAAARRQIGQAETTTEATQMTSLMTSLTANLPPTVGAVFGTPIRATGVVTGQVVATDPEGQALTYKMTAAPTAGKIVFDSATAKFTYTPTSAQRIAAGVTATTADVIAMTVTVSDGTNSVPTVINLPIDAATISKLTEIGAVDAGAVVTTGARAYVTNRTAGTVTMIDTATNTVIRTMPAGGLPDDVAVKPDGTRLYVTSRANNTVTVLNTSTGAVAATIAVANPTAIAINSTGSMVYVTSGTGSVAKVSTMYNKVTSTVKMPTGSTPTGITVSPDRTKLYVTSTKADGGGSVSVIGYTSSTVTKIADFASTPTGLAVSPDNKQLYVSSADGKVSVYNTTTRALLATRTIGGQLAGVATSTDGSLLLTTDTAGRISAVDVATGALVTSFATRASTTPVSVAPDTAVSPDGKQLYVSDYDADKVYVVSLVPSNIAPIVGTPKINAPSATTGAVTGNVVATDADGDSVSFALAGAPTKGTVTVSSTGAFTYTPTATARHAASAVDAPASALTDSFIVSVSDGRNAAVATTVTVGILPANKVPVVSVTVGAPYASTGVVFGSVKSTDGDYDTRAYTTTTLPTKGTVVLSSTGSFTYTPTAQARHAAAKIGATAADKADSFKVTVDDGHGGVVSVTVTVAVSPANAIPTAPTLVSSSTDRYTAVVTGSVKSTDANNDALTYTATAATKGALTMQPDGKFTYTPTMAARNAAAVPGATTSVTTDAVTVTVRDGYGGTATSTLTLTIAPYTAGNIAPTNGAATVNNPTSAIGEVTGTVTADDANANALTYVLESAPTKGLVKLNATTGAFSYVPDVDERYTAASTPTVDTDTFVVAIGDGNGGWTSATVQVQVAPPAAASIDQRSTTVAMAAPDMYFYNQADLDRAFGLLKDSGITSVRLLVPWAGVEPTNDGWQWSRSDMLVNTANAHGIEVLAVLNSTPVWAAPAGTPIYAGAPTSNAEFAEFVGAVATRYKGKIAAYEVWNEPNAMTFWAPQPSAAQYTALLQAAYPAIKAADPDAVVVAAGIAPLIDFGTLTVNAVRYVEEMYLAGAAGYFDAMAYHPYLYGKMFTETTATNPDTPANHLNRIHQLMVANGDGNKKIWVTEYGQPSAYSGEAGQAEYLGDFLRTWRDLDYAGPAYIHTFRDYAHNDENHASFGLYRLDWSPKPALSTVEDVIEENQALLNVE
jgi:YVTN family beta-propeller protein/VCBS repeat-containing protein